MYAVEFETEIENGVIHLPPSLTAIGDAHLRVILLLEEKPPESFLPTPLQPNSAKFDFTDLQGRLQWRGDAVAEQRALRDEW